MILAMGPARAGAVRLALALLAAACPAEELALRAHCRAIAYAPEACGPTAYACAVGPDRILLTVDPLALAPAVLAGLLAHETDHLTGAVHGPNADDDEITARADRVAQRVARAFPAL